MIISVLIYCIIDIKNRLLLTCFRFLVARSLRSGGGNREADLFYIMEEPVKCKPFHGYCEDSTMVVKKI